MAQTTHDRGGIVLGSCCSRQDRRLLLVTVAVTAVVLDKGGDAAGLWSVVPSLRPRSRFVTGTRPRWLSRSAGDGGWW